jgi:hypothetical protein
VDGNGTTLIDSNMETEAGTFVRFCQWILWVWTAYSRIFDLQELTVTGILNALDTRKDNYMKTCKVITVSGHGILMAVFKTKGPLFAIKHTDTYL